MGWFERPDPEAELRRIDAARKAQEEERKRHYSELQKGAPARTPEDMLKDLERINKQQETFPANQPTPEVPVPGRTFAQMQEDLQRIDSQPKASRPQIRASNERSQEEMQREAGGEFKMTPKQRFDAAIQQARLDKMAPDFLLSQIQEIQKLSGLSRAEVLNEIESRQPPKRGVQW